MVHLDGLRLMFANIALILVQTPSAPADGVDLNLEDVHMLRMRSLEQPEVDAGIWVADFTHLPQHIDNTSTPYNITEVQLRGTASVHVAAAAGYQAGHGPYPVGPLQAGQLGLAVATELVRLQTCLSSGSASCSCASHVCTAGLQGLGDAQ